MTQLRVTPLPRIAKEVLRLLRDHPDIQAHLYGGALGTGEIPDPLLAPFVRVSAAGQVGDTARARTIQVQVTPWVPGHALIDGEEPQDIAWDIASVAGQILHACRNITINEDAAWSARWIDGPLDLYDTERGIDRTIFYAPITVEVLISKTNRSLRRTP